MKIFNSIILILVLSLFSGCKNSLTKPKKDGFPDELPEFALKDAHGKKYTSDELKKEPLIVVITAPILSNKSAQEGWEKFLNKDEATVVFLEDMTPSNFKGKALKSMKEESKPGKGPILLIDPKGEVRKKFKVPEKETVVLVFEKKGKRVWVETKEPSKEATHRIWKALGTKGN